LIYLVILFDFGDQYQDKVILNFLNGNLHFLLYIFIIDLESFLKHYNETSFS